jgi:hypothetical protein
LEILQVLFDASNQMLASPDTAPAAAAAKPPKPPPPPPQQMPCCVAGMPATAQATAQAQATLVETAWTEDSWEGWSKSVAAAVRGVAVLQQTSIASGRGSGGEVSRGDVFFIATEPLWAITPAASWAEAWQIGNGAAGALVFGQPWQERVPLAEDTM